MSGNSYPRDDERIDAYNQPTEPMPRLVLPSPARQLSQHTAGLHHTDALPVACSRRSFVLPYGVGLCFVGVQMVLLLRFCCKLGHLSGQSMCIGLLYLVSEIPLAPFHALLPAFSSSLFSYIEPYTLLAIACYGLCSRCIVHWLKCGVRAC